MTKYIERAAAVKIAEKYGTGNGSVLGRHSGVADIIASRIDAIPAADVAPVVHGRCPICRGTVPILQDCNNGYSAEIEGEEMSIWCGDECVAIFSIDFCPACGAKLVGGVDDAAD